MLIEAGLIQDGKAITLRQHAALRRVGPRTSRAAPDDRRNPIHG
jgi:hypothetical protein